MIKTHGYTKCIERRNKCTGGSLFQSIQQIDLPLFSFSPYREIFFLNFNIYGRSVPADWFSPFLYGKGDAMSPFSIVNWREIIGDWEKNKGEREMKNQSAGVDFFNINLLYWEKVEKRKGKINLLELLSQDRSRVPWTSRTASSVVSRHILQLPNISTDRLE